MDQKIRVSEYITGEHFHDVSRDLCANRNDYFSQTTSINRLLCKQLNAPAGADSKPVILEETDP
jgi:hypothetical protein